MPDIRALAVAIGAALAISGYTILWWHWSVAIGLGVGILIGASALVTSVSLGADPSEADAAFRAAAPDLVDDPVDANPLREDPSARPLGPGPGPTSHPAR